MSVRSCVLALAFLLAGAILFAGVGLVAIVFLSYSHCSPALGYYGCDVPTANSQREAEPAARLRDDSRQTTRSP
jgi:hypothetical protein